jgi:hypothetical protein
MNIFVLSMDFEECARFHCNAHVIKMILEYTQILCTVVNQYGYGILADGKVDKPTNTYKSTHIKHPCVLWAGESLDNWLWLQKLTAALNQEYQYRYDSPNPHKSSVIARQLKPPNIPSLGLTSFAQAMPEKRRIKDNAVEAYREFYRNEKRHLLKYKKRTSPEWLKNKLPQNKH